MMNRRLHLASGRGCFVVLVMMHHSLELVKKSRDICAFVIEILQIFSRRNDVVSMCRQLTAVDPVL